MQVAVGIIDEVHMEQVDVGSIESVNVILAMHVVVELTEDPYGDVTELIFSVSVTPVELGIVDIDPGTVKITLEGPADVIEELIVPVLDGMELILLLIDEIVEVLETLWILELDDEVDVDAAVELDEVIKLLELAGVDEGIRILEVRVGTVEIEVEIELLGLILVTEETELDALDDRVIELLVLELKVGLIEVRILEDEYIKVDEEIEELEVMES